MGPEREEIVSTSARLAIIATAVLVIPAAIVQGRAQDQGVRGVMAAVWPYVLDDLYGGNFGAYGPEIYAPDQTYLQIYLQGGLPTATDPQPIVRQGG